MGRGLKTCAITDAGESMKGPGIRLQSRKWQIIGGFFGVIASMMVAEQAQGASYLLTSQNSTINLDLGTSAGMRDWTVDGTDQLNQQWFWYRVGPVGPQSDVTQITTSPFVSTPNSRQLTAVYTNNVLTYGVRLDYTLAGQAAGSGKSGLTETVRIYNFSSSPLDFHLFMYSDFMVGGATQLGNQYVTIGNDGLGDSTVLQSLGNLGVATNSFVGMTAANRYEAALYPQTYNALTTGLGYSLNNNASAGPGHVTWALQWDLTIPANSSIPLSLLDNLQVPEPSLGGLVLLGLGLCAWRRKRKSV